MTGLKSQPITSRCQNDDINSRDSRAHDVTMTYLTTKDAQCPLLGRVLGPFLGEAWIQSYLKGTELIPPNYSGNTFGAGGRVNSPLIALDTIGDIWWESVLEGVRYGVM